MPPAVVDGNLRRRKAGVGKRADGDAHGSFLTIFSMKHGGPANGTEPETKLCSLIPGAHIFGGVAEDLIRSREAGQGRKHTAGSLLAGKAVANADAARFAFDLNAQLSAGASS